MVFVDTPVWIEFFRNPETLAADMLAALIRDHNRVALCGIVLQEILRGLRVKKSYELARERLLKFPLLESNRDTWLLAASLYRDLRPQGVTLPPVDVTIAAPAIQNDMPLFTRDNHFESVAPHSRMRLFR